MNEFLVQKEMKVDSQVWVIYSTTAMQSQTNIFIASLACSDLLLLLVGVPFDLVHMWKVEEIMRAPAYCQLASKFHSQAFFFF